MIHLPQVEKYYLRPYLSKIMKNSLACTCAMAYLEKKMRGNAVRYSGAFDLFVRRLSSKIKLNIISVL